MCNTALNNNENDAIIYFYKGIILSKKGKNSLAIENFTKSIKMSPNTSGAYFNRGQCFFKDKMFKSALEDFNYSFKLNPKRDFLKGYIILSKLCICEWDELDSLIIDLKKDLEFNKLSATPWSTISMFDDIELQQKAAQMFSNKIASLNFDFKISKSKKKLKIGYFSSDFYFHPVSQQIVGVLENHNKKKFELYGFSFGKNRDQMFYRVKNTFNKFFDVSEKSNDEIIDLCRKLNLDIAIDLNGYTASNRFPVFKKRCAPIQINFLGYPCTMGTSCINYIIADKVLIPKKLKKNYSERIIFMPDTFIPNDNNLKISKKNYTRFDFSLPEKVFVYCCFNKNYKINPIQFNSWINILRETKDSVIWLNYANKYAENSLKKILEKNGLDPKRLIFSKPLSKYEDHLSRHSLADLFLDTFPFGAHSTSCASLWSGLPILTLRGETFASRICSSVLTCFDLEELIAKNRQEYETKAINFANDKKTITNLKRKVFENIKKSTLFDTIAYTKNFEKALMNSYENFASNIKDNIVV